MPLKHLLACLGLVLFISTSLGIEISCHFETTEWVRTGEQYSCDPSDVVDSRNPRHVTNISGTHEPGKNHTDVTVFTSDNNTSLEKLPRGIGKFFPNLVLFRWVGGNLKSVSSLELKHFRKLIGVTFRGNKIQSLDGNLFQHTRSLRIISFKSNELTLVGPGLLDVLDDLYDACFTSNPCIDYEAKDKTEVITLKSLLEKNCGVPADRMIPTQRSYG